MTINKTNTTLIAGETLTLTATMNLIPTVTATLTWSIEGGNNNIASINGDILHALTVGTVEISATTIALDGSTRTGTQEFTVTPVPPVVRPTITTAFNAPMATGVPNQVQISWAAVAGANGYTLYRTTDNLSNLVDSNPDNLSATNQLTATVTTASNADVLLSGTDKWYFLVTATTNGLESKTNGAQTVATAHPLTFATVNGAASTVWMDRNLGAEQAATSATDTLAYGDYYQWGRARDGHQLQGSTPTATLAPNISPNHAQFITIGTAPNDWTAAGVDDDGAARAAFWSRIDGSICPTGFRVPTTAELLAERDSWSSRDIISAFASNLNWTVDGTRSNRNGSLSDVGESVRYWASDVTGSNADSLLVTTASALIITDARASGFSVRCIQN